MRRQINILIFLLVLLLALSCRKKEKETTTYIKTINKSGISLDTLVIRCNQDFSRQYSYYNVQDNDTTNQEIVNNVSCVVHFEIKAKGRFFMTNMNASGMIDPSSTLLDGFYTFYIVECDSLTQLVTIAYVYSKE